MARFTRLAALGTFLVIVQVSVFPHLRLLGAVPDLGLLLTVTVGFNLGAEPALVSGFLAGFAYDLFLETPLGLSALAYALTGYAVGILQTGVIRSPRWVSPFLGGIAGLLSGTTFVVVGVLSGANVAFTNRTFALLGAAALYDMILAPFVFVLTQRVIGREPEPFTAGWAR